MTTTKNVLKATKLRHFTTAEVHTDYQGMFSPICNARKIGGYVVAQGTKDLFTASGVVEVNCPRCLKIENA